METENHDYVMPAEWSPHRTTYTAWPAYEFAWGPGLRAAQSEFCAFVRAWSAEPAQEPLTILVAPDVMAEAQAALGDLVEKAQLAPFAYGDVWVRDTAPLFVKGAKGLASVRFQFNGWGEKYLYPHDDTVAVRLAARAGVPNYAYDFVLEGGAVEVDGLGTCLTTRSCLQNPNRGKSAGAAAERRRPTTTGTVTADAETVTDAVIAKRLHAALGITQVVWIDGGLANDHTDGHIDNIARFVSEGTVVCMQAQTPDDPNRDTLDAIFETLKNAQDARGRALKVVRIASPGRVLSSEGAVMPASYMNFIVGNKRVLMPAFGTPWDAQAVRDLQAVFPRHEVVPCSARAILEGGGTFHCMTQQEPLP